MFRLYNHHQGAYSLCFAKVIIVKQSAKIRRYGISSAVWPHSGDTATRNMWQKFSYNFNVSFNNSLEQYSCALVG